MCYVKRIIRSEAFDVESSSSQIERERKEQKSRTQVLDPRDRGGFLMFAQGGSLWKLSLGGGTSGIFMNGTEWRFVT